MEKEFVRYNWKEYKEMLERYDYTQEQIEWVKEVREQYDLMTADQFRFLFLSGIVKRTVKNKKPRNYYTNGEDIVYLNHHLKVFQKAGFFVEGE